MRILTVTEKFLTRIYHPYWVWEEVSFNMWGAVKDKASLLRKAIEFTGNSELYGKYMMRVAKEWKCSCEHNLTNLEQNRKAWIGHAACALAFRCPEGIVREAWGYLSEEQQRKANEVAQKTIEWWESCQKHD